MAHFRGLNHQIARLFLLAFCVSLLTTVSLSFAPCPLLARTSHIVQGPGDMGGALESKPDQWGAPEGSIFPATQRPAGVVETRRRSARRYC